MFVETWMRSNPNHQGMVHYGLPGLAGGPKVRQRVGLARRADNVF